MTTWTLWIGALLVVGGLRFPPNGGQGIKRLEPERPRTAIVRSRPG